MFFMNREKTIWLLLLPLVYYPSLQNCQYFEVGSCSQKCQKGALPENGTIPAGSVDNHPPLTCSCSRSCFVYGDCCYDSKYRVVGQVPVLRKICLTLSGKATYKVIAGCPAYWLRSSAFCSEGIGHLPPVTSTTSGVTFANIHCAICNNDAEQLTIWNVYLKCCPEHDDLEEQTERHFEYSNDNLQSVIPDQGDGSPRRCSCKFVANDRNNNFTDSLELRVCKRRIAISKCSSTWTNQSVRALCDSFKEPISSQKKVYRNVYCAQCNYKNLDSLRCLPAVVERMLSEGSSFDDILTHCEESNLIDCLYYFSFIDGRGRSYAFSRLMNINIQECVPEAGKRCCVGERYDFRSKRCRKTH